MEHVAAVVIGAGVVGLSIARELARRGHETLILEAAARCGTEASSHNSEVIHAGLYYPCGSLKARLCVAGRERLYAYCRERGVAHRRCGKLIVAADQPELADLAGIACTARANGVELTPLEPAAVRALEPELTVAGALHSPLTGIIDSNAYMLALLADAEGCGATLACRTAVTRLVLEERGIAVAVNGGEPGVRARLLVNCAGVQAPAVAARMEGFPAAHIPRAHIAKGNYFNLTGHAPFQRLVYPLPQAGGLGIHLTLDLGGRARFGPDVEWLDSLDESSAGRREALCVDPQRAAGFYAAVRRYWPGLPDGALAPAYAGMRARITGRGEPAADFRIDGAAVHGIAGVLNLFGIDSPGLTASLALASEAVAQIVD